MKKLSKVFTLVLLSCMLIGASPIYASENVSNVTIERAPVYSVRNYTKTQQIGNDNVKVQITAEVLIGAVENLVIYKPNSAKVISPSSYKISQVYYYENPSGSNSGLIVDVMVYKVGVGKERVITFEITKDGILKD